MGFMVGRRQFSSAALADYSAARSTHAAKPAIRRAAAAWRAEFADISVTPTLAIQLHHATPSP
jgi:hypothetical protein